MRVVAVLLFGPATVDEIAARSGLPPDVCRRAVADLARAELAAPEGDRWRLDEAALLGALRAVAAADRPRDDEETDPVLRAFIRDGRLTGLPAGRAKRLVVLDHVAAAFEPGVRYAEPDVNARLAEVFDDVAALRRALVDEEFLSRDHGWYWRSGGTVPV